MKRITLVDRLLLLGAGMLAAYQVVSGIDGLPFLPMVLYTVAFGALLVAGLLVLLLDYEILESSPVAILATIVPLCLSAGLVSEHYPAYGPAFTGFSAFGFGLVALTRLVWPGVGATLVLATVHAIAGGVISMLPIYLSLSGWAAPGYALVGLGGALIGLGGLTMSLLKTGHPVLSEKKIAALFPAMLFLTTAAFVGGFWLA